MSTISRISLAVLFAAACLAFASYAFAIEPYAQCLQDKMATGMSADQAGTACYTPSTQTTQTGSDGEPYAICINQKVATGMSQAAAASACNVQYSSPTYPAAYITCIQQHSTLGSYDEVASATACAQHLPARTQDNTTLYNTCIQQVAAFGLGNEAAVAACRAAYPGAQTTVTVTPTNTNTTTQTPTIASLLADLARIQAQIAQLIGTSTGAGSCEAFSGLSRGMSSASVIQAQQTLIAQGFLAAGNNTGFFGPLTEDAVQAFQSARGIVSSGTPESTGWGRIGPRTGLALGLCS